MRPSKALGQNFLHNRRIVERIADAAELTPNDLVVEVGPGLGILTQELAKRAGAVIAIELDRRLAAYLRETFTDGPVTIVEADILTVDLDSLVGGQPYTVVANLPYSVAAAAIQRLLEAPTPPKRMVVMVQREVAERIAAQPPQMSILAVAVQLYAEPKVLFRVSPGSFVPRPKVDSAVIRIDLKPEPPVSGAARDTFFRLVRAGFGQRRKRLANALADGLDQPKAEVEALLSRAGVDPDRRAETLSVAEWLAVHEAFRDRFDSAE